MLSIYFGYMSEEDGYYPNAKEEFDEMFASYPEWLSSELSKEMIKDIDKSTVVSTHIIESPVLGPITPKDLSGGVKTLIMMNEFPEWHVNASSCGDNCAKWILKISENKDITIRLGHVMHFPEPFKIKIINNNKVYTDAFEYEMAGYKLLEGIYKGE